MLFVGSRNTFCSKKRWYLLVLGIALVLPKTASAVEHSVTVSRHSNVAIGNADVDGYLAEGSRRLRADNDGTGNSDVACDVTLKRSVSVQLFQKGGPATINSSADEALVDSENTLYKVVTAINTCGGDAGSVNGCATSPGNSIIVIRTTADTAGTWVHEFGHTPGLRHSADRKGIMYKTGIAGRNRVTASECAKFKEGPPNVLVASTSKFGENHSHQDSQLEHHATTDLLSYSLSGFLPRVPWEDTEAFRGEELTPLHQALFENRYSASWGDIATILGILGNEETVSVLLRFLIADSPGVDIQSVRLAKNNALLALGYLANQLNDEASLNALRNFSSVNSWEGQGSWLGLTTIERGNVARDLSEVAILGLALSGREEVLQLLSADKVNLDAQKGENRNRSFLEEIRSIHSEIARTSLREYYSE